jgi:hypothetical protein
MPVYCAILIHYVGPDDRLFFPTKHRALRSARAFVRKHGGAAAVAWCKDGQPKVWLAHVAWDGVSLTEFWDEPMEASDV